jgi:hypothetical protein
MGGRARDGNAIDARHAAVKELFFGGRGKEMVARPGRGDLRKLLATDDPVPDDVEAFIGDNARALAAFRESSRYAWACDRNLARERPEEGTYRDAMALLLLDARRSAAEPWLSIALDVIQLFEDAQTGFASAPFVWRSFLDREKDPKSEPSYAPLYWPHQVERTIGRCALRAGADVLAARRATRRSSPTALCPSATPSRSKRSATRISWSPSAETRATCEGTTSCGFSADTSSTRPKLF